MRKYIVFIDFYPRMRSKVGFTKGFELEYESIGFFLYKVKI